MFDLKNAWKFHDSPTEYIPNHSSELKRAVKRGFSIDNGTHLFYLKLFSIVRSPQSIKWKYFEWLNISREFAVMYRLKAIVMNRGHWTEVDGASDILHMCWMPFSMFPVCDFGFFFNSNLFTSNPLRLRQAIEMKTTTVFDCVVR